MCTQFRSSLWVFLLIFLAFASSCREKSSQRLVVVIVPSEDNPFFKSEADAAAAAARALGYAVRIDAHGDDAYKQDNLIDMAIASNAAALILDNAGADASTSAVKRATAAGIKCFLIDREINQSGIALAQIAADNFQGALLGGREFEGLMKGKGPYAELLGKESDTNAQVRTRGFHSVLDQSPGLVLASAQSANWSQSEAFSKTETVLQAHGDLKGILAGNDTMAVGAAAAVKANGKSLIIVGFDGSPDALNAIRSGQMAATVLQPAVAIAKLAVSEMDTFFRTGSTGKPERQPIPCELVTRQNVNEFGVFTRKE
jgi:erythritol transport system substrate-binding protein